MKNKKIFFMLFFLCVIVFALTFNESKISVLADVGNTFSGGESSSSSSGQGNTYGGGGSSTVVYSDDSGFILYYLLFGIPFPINIFLFILVIFLIRYARYGTISNKNNNNAKLNNQEKEIQFTLNEASIIKKISADDENFSKNEFLRYAENVFITVQEAWGKRQWESIRPFESNELFERHSKQLNEYIEKNLYPHLDGQEILNSMITNYEIDGKYQYLTVKLSANVIDFTTDEKGEVVEGSKTKRLYRQYKLKFKRVNGVKTKIKDSISTTNCPNCGAPNSILSSGKCEYCNSLITTGEYGFVLDEYSKWS